MKTGIIIFHKNIFQLYQKDWVTRCLDSVRNQTCKDFVVYELCYSQDKLQLWEGSNYEHVPMENHIFALNHLLDRAFGDGCDAVSIVNLDDLYNWNKTELQLKAVEAGYDLVSTNFTHINEHDHAIRDMRFHEKNIAFELSTNHNVICHSGLLLTKNFWNKYKYYNTNSLGYEDMELWQKAAVNNCKMIILPEILCYHRIHANQTGRIHNPTLKQNT